jgi:1-deoxy-D-xylulose-5-phosphate reductoisomerase
MVEFTDGCVMAQMSNPDMTLPIQYALTYPNRTDCHIKPLNLFDVQKLEFYKPNFKKFECLNIAYNCAGIGYSAPAVMSAANEVAVYSFINKKIKFNEIPQIVKEVLKKHKLIKTNKIKDLIKVDLWARQQATVIIESKKR